MWVVPVGKGKNKNTNIISTHQPLSATLSHSQPTKANTGTTGCHMGNGTHTHTATHNTTPHVLYFRNALSNKTCSPASIIAQGTSLSGEQYKEGSGSVSQVGRARVHGITTERAGGNSKRALHCAVAAGCVAAMALAALIAVVVIFFSS